MKRVFVDTGGFVGLLVAEDRDHARASALFELAARDRWTLVTTNAIVIETYSVLLARARDGRRAAITFLDADTADQSGALVNWVSLPVEGCELRSCLLTSCGKPHSGTWTIAAAAAVAASSSNQPIAQLAEGYSAGCVCRYCHAAKFVDSIDDGFAVVAMTGVVTKPHDLSQPLDRFARNQRRTKPFNRQPSIAQ